MQFRTLEDLREYLWNMDDLQFEKIRQREQSLTVNDEAMHFQLSPEKNFPKCCDIKTLLEIFGSAILTPRAAQSKVHRQEIACE